MKSDNLTYIKNLVSKYPVDKLTDYLNKLKHSNILVIGETIIDEYVPCIAFGKAGKDPILTLKRLDSKLFLGGAAAIANQVAALTNNVYYVSAIGNNSEFKEFIDENLCSNINSHLINKENSPTIRKTRYYSKDNNAKIIGVYDLNDDIIGQNIENIFIDKLNEILPKIDLIIVADYGHGMISNKIIKMLTSSNKFLCVNTQLNSANIGFHTISKYDNVSYACMHEGELRHDFRSRDDKIEDLTLQLSNKVNAQYVTVTQGNRGAICHHKQKFYYCPAFANKIVDKVGAGDSLFGLSAILIGNNVPIDASLFIGSVFASETIQNLANSKVIRTSELEEIIREKCQQI